MKLKSVHLLNAINVPGTKMLGTTSLVPDRYPSLKLELVSHGVMATLNGISAIIPMSNISVIVLDNKLEEVKAKAA